MRLVIAVIKLAYISLTVYDAFVSLELPPQQVMTKNVGFNILSMVEELFPYAYSVAGNPPKEAISAFCRLANFEVHTYPSGSDLRGWRIPNGWEAAEATISHNGSVIHDCLASSPLGCAYLSEDFKGNVDKRELLRHCAWREDLPNATVYDWTRLYRQGIKDWGLCIPWRTLMALPDQDLLINITTRSYPSDMIVYDLLVPGKSSSEILINAHNCHPFQANDDLSGCATAIALFKALSAGSHNFSYRLLIGPELYGPMFWLEQNPHLSQNIIAAILLKSVGNDSSLKVQSSYSERSYIDKVVQGALITEHAPSADFYPFRTYYGNDETVFEAPGLEIPSITLTRYPFQEYHTDLDNPSILSAKKLSETFEALGSIIRILETNMYASDVRPGLHCLSSPKYNLYRKAPEPGISSDGTSENEKRWNLLMNCLSRDMSQGASILDLSMRYALPYELVQDYVLEWERKGLLKLENVMA